MSQGQSIDFLQVGKGRIGLPLFNCLKTINQTYQSATLARLDPKLGLLNLKPSQCYDIKQLVICIAPATTNTATLKRQFWKQIFVGLKEQVRSGQLVIRKLYFVSSTRVYDGIKSGVVEASSPTDSHSKMGQALVFAEQMLINLSQQCYLFRAAGLVGDSYPKYQNFLKSKDSKLRFAVADWQLIEQMIQQIQSSQVGDGADNSVSPCHSFLVTDGKGYLNGQVMSWQSWQSQSRELKEQQRWLKASSCP